MADDRIASVFALEVLDSRGTPTVEVEVVLEDGSRGQAIVPSGASTGSHEAHELRDGDPKRYLGKGVLTAVANVNSQLGPAIRGMSVGDQEALDRTLIDLDGTPNKERLGANALLGVSLAAAHASAASQGKPLYTTLGERQSNLLPLPLFNVLNGGRHALQSTDFQEFMLAPIGLPTFNEALAAGMEVYQALKKILGGRGLSTKRGRRGWLRAVLAQQRRGRRAAGRGDPGRRLSPGDDVAIALDPATSELYENGRYVLASEDRSLSSEELVGLWKSGATTTPLSASRTAWLRMTGTDGPCCDSASATASSW